MDKFMKLAFELAKKANPFPNPRVGAVVVKDNKILGVGYHRKAGTPHAEKEAIEKADKRYGKKALEGATLYVTLEPCSHKNKRTVPCTEAIIASGIKKVVFAMKDPNPFVNGRAKLKKRGIEVKGPKAEKKARILNNEYLDHLSKKPFVAIKMAMTADGKTATITGNSKWISSKESRRHVHKLRSEYDAVMVGARTIKKDNPKLTARIRGGKNPYRIIVDGKLSVPLSSHVMRYDDGKTIIATSKNASKKKIKQMEKRSIVFVYGKKEVDMNELISGLSAMGIKKILIEGGSELNAKAIESGIVDKLYLFIGPKLIGGNKAKGVIGGKGIANMKDAIVLKNMKTRRFGKDLMLEFDIVNV